MGGVPWGNATNYIGEILGLRCGAPPHLAFVAPLRPWPLPATALKLNSNVPVRVRLYSYLICTGTGTYGTRVPGYCSIHGEL